VETAKFLFNFHLVYILHGHGSIALYFGGMDDSAMVYI